MHQLRARLRRRNTQVSRPDRIDLIGVIYIRLAFIHIRVRRAVDDGVRPYLPDKGEHRIDIRNIERPCP